MLKIIIKKKKIAIDSTNLEMGKKQNNKIIKKKKYSKKYKRKQVIKTKINDFLKNQKKNCLFVQIHGKYLMSKKKKNYSKK